MSPSGARPPNNRGTAPEGAPVVAMRETGIQSRSGGSDDEVPDVVELLQDLQSAAGDVVGRLRESTRETAGQAKEKVAEMTRAITGSLKEEAERLFDEQKEKASGKVGRVGKSLNQAAHALRAVKADAVAEYVDTAAERVQGFSDYIEERNLAQVLEDAGELARRNPGLVVGGMFLAGLAAARFLKASTPEGGNGSGSGERRSSRGSSGSGRSSGGSSRRR